MSTSVRECYGFPVALTADPAAGAVLDAFFGPERPGAEHAGPAPEIRLTVTVVDDDTPSAEPPHTEAVIAADPVVIDTGASRAVIDPASWSAEIALARKDLDDPIVWGRWIFERLFLYLVCRSPRHYPVHAGAVGLDGTVVLVSAPTDVGKSTFTWWAAHRGADLMGEDIMVRHLDDPVLRFWGYPRAVYVSPDVLARSPELAGAVRAEVAGKGKSRVTLPDPMGGRLRSAAVPDLLVFLTRGDAPAVRPLGTDEAVERCRDDIHTGKPDPAVRTAVAADLRACAAALTVLELTVTPDHDAGLDLLRSCVRATV